MMSAPSLASELERLQEVRLLDLSVDDVRQVVALLTAISQTEKSDDMGGKPPVPRHTAPPSSFREEKTIQQLSTPQQDTLMRCLYFAMQSSCIPSEIALQWHSALYEIAGSGAIMRCLVC